MGMAARQLVMGAYMGCFCITEFDLHAAIFDGCAFGLLSASARNKGQPIKKPWALASDCPALVPAFSGKGCPGEPKHAPTQGADAERTG